ncbi:hypothetical protein [Shimia aestuarii]|uniref:Uncharacterized protein n=1 Tax=Shimia aestuarii TaxID=254406 RepID=A0A1I4PAS3_9RHOB|nr:hypothetical protein [Shimia aestuarii]SFM24809.1 hypothetical protein SAMN04488042_105152 [Shimia aestuarii]
MSSGIKMRNVGSASFSDVHIDGFETGVDAKDVGRLAMRSVSVVEAITAFKLDTISELEVSETTLTSRVEKLVSKLESHQETKELLKNAREELATASGTQDAVDRLKRSGLGRWLAGQQFVAWLTLAVALMPS